MSTGHEIMPTPRGFSLDVFSAIIQMLFEHLPEMWKFVLFCMTALIIGVLIALSKNVLKNVAIAASLFLLLQSSQIFITSDEILINFLPYIAGFTIAGFSLGYLKDKSVLWVCAICTSLIVAAIGTPIKLALNMDEVPLNIVVMSFFIGIVLDFVLLIIFAKISGIFLRPN